MSEPDYSAPGDAVTSPERSPSTAPALGTDDARLPLTGPAGMTGVSSLRGALLVHLRRSGPSSPDRLADELGASRTGVLQQLRALESAGLVRRETVRHGVGRPRHIYDVTELAQGLFPAAYDGLATGLVAAIRAVGGDGLVDEVFEARGRMATERVRARLAQRLPDGATVLDRAAELARIQDEQGYLAEALLGPDGVIRVVEHNCAIHRVARDQQAACRAELALFREVLGPDVERETHIAGGDRCCTYRVSDAPVAPGDSRAVTPASTPAASLGAP
jgi:predicted ArsR family transcriptional regulator